MMNIVHFVDSRSQGGIHREARQLAELFSKSGYRSHVLTYDGSARDEDSQLNFDKEDWLIIHFDMHDLPWELENHNPDRTIVLLQDHVAQGKDDEYGQSTRAMFADAREQLKELCSKAVVSIAHVNKGVEILAEIGSGRVRKIPVYIDDTSFDARPDEFTLKLYPGDIMRMLFVGEVDSESGVDDLYTTFWYYRRFVEQWDQQWNLLICGEHSRCESYSRRLKELVKRFELDQFLVTHATQVNDHQLSAIFDRSAVMVSFDRGDLRGEHILRAIGLGMPVIGFADAAAEDILGDGELIVNPMTHSAVADRLALLQTDEEWARLALKQQYNRLENYRPEAVTFLWNALLSRFVNH